MNQGSLFGADTLTEARNKVLENRREGVTCPCCGQFVKEYRRKLNAGMAFTLVMLYKRTYDGDWLHSGELQHQTSYKFTKAIMEYSKLRHWRLAESGPDPGEWRITELGKQFVESKLQVPKKVYLCGGQIVGYSDETTTIREAAGDKFDLDELLNDLDERPSDDMSKPVAIVTGGSGGIGKAVVRRLQREYEVLAPDHVECPVEHWERVVGWMTGLGRIEVLVNCAAARQYPTQAKDLTAVGFLEVLKIDVAGTFHMCKASARRMIVQGYGRIINFSSIHDQQTFPDRAAYATAKAAVAGLTRQLAVEWGKHGITVNCVAPGCVETPRVRATFEANAHAEKFITGQTPNGRLAKPEEVAALVAFLASQEAGHINGETITIDGGWTKNRWWGSFL